MSQLRVLFLGNHTVGVEALRALRSNANVVGVVAHPPDPEDGVRYDSVFAYAVSASIPAIRAKGRSPAVREFALSVAPDLLWVTDYRYLLPSDLTSVAPLGAVNLHPSLLPRYRGRAPINWAIINGETKLGLTAHFIADGVDNGDIILQKSFYLGSDEDVGNALEKLIPLYRDITTEVILAFVTHRRVQSFAQVVDGVGAYPARRPEDGEVDWAQPALDIMNLVRAVARPYPGAFTFLKGTKVFLWKVALHQESPIGRPGEVIGMDGTIPVVSCGNGAIDIREFCIESADKTQIRVGDLLGSQS